MREHILAPLDEPGPAGAARGRRVPAARDRGELPERACSTRGPAASAASTCSGTTPRSAFVLSESLRQPQRVHRLAVGERAASSHPAHALPDAPSHLHDPGRSRARLARDDARSRSSPGRRRATTCRGPTARLIARARSSTARARARGARCATRPCRLDTPDDAARSRLRVGEGEPRRGDGLQPRPRLRSGRGLRPVGREHSGPASAGSSAATRRSTRSRCRRSGQFDAGAAGPALLREATSAPTARSRTRSRRRRRASRWFTDYPYAYYHADTTPFWLLALSAHWRATGDRALRRASCGPPRRRRYAWCLTTDTDGDGLMENTTAGRRDRGRRDRRGHPPGRLPRRGVDGRRRAMASWPARGDTALAAEAHAALPDGRARRSRSATG